MNITTVAVLTNFLINMLPDHAGAPQTSPTWNGGVMATWELGDMRLAIGTSPGRAAQHCYVHERNGNDFGEEGDVRGNEERVRHGAVNIADIELH